MKLRIAIAAVLAVLPASVQAGPRDDVVDVLVKCTDVADKVGRLDCYDRLAPQLRAAARTPPGTPAATQTGVQAPSSNMPPSEQAAAPPPPQEGGLFSFLGPFDSGEVRSGPSPQQMEYQPIGQEILPLTIGVSDYTIAPSGAFTVTLDNGQVWREHAYNFATPPFRSDRKNVVIIKRGVLGSYNLYLKGYYGKLYKVVRVK